MPSFSLNIAATGLMAQQSYIDTISKNIANKDVQGYKRQESTFSTIQNNGGVQHKAYTNNYPWLDNNLALKSSEYSRQTSIKDSISGLDNLFSNNNVETAYGDFLNASKNLQMFPNSAQYLQEFNAAGKFLNDSVVQVNDSLDQMQRMVNKKIELGTIELDSLKTQLDDLSSNGINETNSNDIQLLRQKISSLTGTINGYKEYSANTLSPVSADFKNSMSDMFGKINQAGGTTMFSDGQWIDQTSVNTQQVNNSQDILSFGDVFGRIKTHIGTIVNSADLHAKFAQSQYDQASKEYDDAYGVKVEEELVNMMRAQKMYEANAKMLQVSDNVIGSLLNAIG